MRLRLSYPHVTSTLALVLALGTGGAYAATSLAKNSVGSPQIKPGAVHGSDLAANAVTGAKVAPHSLTGSDIATSTLGLPPSGRVYSSDTQQQAASLTSTPTAFASVTATAPAAGYLVVTADSSFNSQAGGPGDVTAELMLDGNAVGGQYWSSGPGNGVFQSQSMTTAVPVTKGAHTIALDLSQGGSQPALAYLSQVTVEYVPVGHAGQTQLPD